MNNQLLRLIDNSDQLLNKNVEPRKKGVYTYTELSINAKINYKGRYQNDKISSVIGFVKSSNVWVASQLV